jgi:hypothetical protein
MKSHFFHFAIALIVVIVVLVGYGFWYAALSAKSAAVANQESRIVAQTETVSRIASARAVLAEIAGDEASVENYFVSETGVVAFIDGLEAQGEAQGAVVEVGSVSAGTAGVRPTFILSLAIKGAFDAVMRTIGAIEYVPYDLSISGLSLTQDNEGRWHADLKITVGSVGSKTKTP